MEIDLGKKCKAKIPVWFCGDLHLGSPNFLGGLFSKWLEWAKEAKPRIILMGDLIEAALPSHRYSQAVWTQTMNPDEQIDKIVEYFKDFTTVDAIISGNHERRIYNISSIDPMKVVADRLGAPFIGFGGEITYLLGKQRYAGLVFHGSGMSTDPAGQLNKAYHIYHGYDFMAMGHNHRLFSDVVRSETPQGKHFTYRIRTGSFTDYEEYAAEKFYPPGIPGSALMYLYKDKKIISVNTSGFPGSEDGNT